MRLALYIGDHSSDTWIVRLGWWATRLVQKGKYAQVTHVEAIHAEHDDGTVTIASASIRDGGVRIKRCVLDTDHWMIADVPSWDVAKSIQWFTEHLGEKYDARGAFASAMPIQWKTSNRWFCNESVSAPFLECPEIFGPSQFAAIAFTIGEDVTNRFFRKW